MCGACLAFVVKTVLPGIYTLSETLRSALYQESLVSYVAFCVLLFSFPTVLLVAINGPSKSYS